MVIRNVKKFEETIIPTMYKHNNFSSFVRQLNFCKDLELKLIFVICMSLCFSKMVSVRLNPLSPPSNVGSLDTPILFVTSLPQFLLLRERCTTVNYIHLLVLLSSSIQT